MSSVSFSQRLRAEIYAKEGSTWCGIHHSSHGCCLCLNWKRWEYIFFFPLIWVQQTTTKGMHSFSALACKAGQTQVVLGISAICARGCVACWGRGKVVCASWTSLCLVGWGSAALGWAEHAGVLQSVWAITLPCAKTMRMGHTHTGQMASLAVLGVSTQEAICLWVEQWLITCPLAATVLGEN